MNQQDQDFNYFLENMERFYHAYGQKFVVIKNQSILAVYDDFMDAYETTVKTEELGTFLIQECFDDAEKMVSYFHCNIIPASA